MILPRLCGKPYLPRVCLGYLVVGESLHITRPSSLSGPLGSSDTLQTVLVLASYPSSNPVTSSTVRDLDMVKARICSCSKLISGNMRFHSLPEITIRVNQGLIDRVTEPY